MKSKWTINQRLMNETLDKQQQISNDEQLTNFFKWNSLSYFKVVIIGKILHLAYSHSLNEIISWNSSKGMLTARYIYIYIFVGSFQLCSHCVHKDNLTSIILWHVPFSIIDEDCTNEIGFTMLARVKHDVQPLCHGVSPPLHAI
jgi:hypothetical protein